MADPLMEEEHRFCHQLLIENISILEKTEIYATGAVAATMFFSLSLSDRTLAVFSSFVPLLISILGVIRWIGLDGVIGALNDYMVVLSKELPEGGWTQFYRDHRPRSLKRSRWLIWGLLLTTSTAFLVLTVSLGPFGPAPDPAERPHARHADPPNSPAAAVPHRVPEGAAPPHDRPQPANSQAR